MEDKQLRKIALFLEIITEELYVARIDRDLEKAKPADTKKLAESRQFVLEEMEKTRQLLG
jgi:hypothetical protein